MLEETPKEDNDKTHISNMPLFSTSTIEEFKSNKSFQAYVKYETLENQYNSYMNILNKFNDAIRKLIQKTNQLEREARIAKFRYDKSHEERFNDEYKLKQERITVEKQKIAELQSEIKSYSEKIANLENEMSSFIFDSELSMETAYQDNRYTSEGETNNNFDNMLLLLNCLKLFVVQEYISFPDYATEFASIKKSPPGERPTIISPSKGEIEVFDRLFSRSDDKFTCQGRKTREGQISRFFQSKNNPELDSLYSAELRYLGALQVKDNDNLYIAEIAMASELYIKSILRFNEETHSLIDLFNKLDEEIIKNIINRVNDILGVNLTIQEFKTKLENPNISNAFKEYRYLYEKEPNQEDIDFLSALTETLHQVSSEVLNYTSPYHQEIDNTLHPEEDSYNR